MNIDKYRMLLEAVDTGSLSKAAEKFDYTPSGMVHIVNSLEQEFSFPILQRSNKGVSLTAEGSVSCPSCARSLSGRSSYGRSHPPFAA